MTEFDPFEMCWILNEEQVDYVVLGGFTAVVHGSPLPTEDIDVRTARARVGRCVTNFAVRAKADYARQAHGRWTFEFCQMTKLCSNNVREIVRSSRTPCHIGCRAAAHHGSGGHRVRQPRIRGSFDSEHCRTRRSAPGSTRLPRGLEIGYHVGSKEELWRATLDFLFVRLRAHLDRALPESTDELVADPVSMFADVIRLHVRHTAKHPELSRIMLMEGAKKSPRSDWLLRHHVRPTLAALQLVWADVRAMGRGRGMSAEEVFMLMVGLAPMPFAQAGIMRPLLGAKRCAPDVHAASMINWILG